MKVFLLTAQHKHHNIIRQKNLLLLIYIEEKEKENIMMCSQLSMLMEKKRKKSFKLHCHKNQMFSKYLHIILYFTIRKDHFFVLFFAFQRKR